MHNCSQQNIFHINFVHNSTHLLSIICEYISYNYNRSHYILIIWMKIKKILGVKNWFVDIYKKFVIQFEVWAIMNSCLKLANCSKYIYSISSALQGESCIDCAYHTCKSFTKQSHKTLTHNLPVTQLSIAW